MKCDIDVRKDLCSNNVLSRGSTMISGIVERIVERIEKAMISFASPIMKIKVEASEERRYQEYIDGSIFASFSIFSQMIIKKMSTQNQNHQLFA
jgi:actin-related protein